MSVFDKVLIHSPRVLELVSASTATPGCPIGYECKQFTRRWSQEAQAGGWGFLTQGIETSHQE